MWNKWIKRPTELIVAALFAFGGFLTFTRGNGPQTVLWIVSLSLWAFALYSVYEAFKKSDE